MTVMSDNLDEEFPNMDGSIHIIESEGKCACGGARMNGRCRECQGALHYQSVYGGYYKTCEECKRSYL